MHGSDALGCYYEPVDDDAAHVPSSHDVPGPHDAPEL
jgi:hypothetical protein